MNLSLGLRTVLSLGPSVRTGHGPALGLTLILELREGRVTNDQEALRVT